MPGGAIRQANLRLLFERAIEFEETGQKGLFHFVRYLERLAEAGGIASAAEPSANSDKVRLMTIHKSKGLEFPIVICAFLAKKFNTDDERRPVILHSAEGIGPYYVDTALRTRSNTLARFALSRQTRRENLSEELRCLYVAMTRAKELLILTARVKNLESATEKWNDHIGDPEAVLPTHYRRAATSYLDWLMPCILRRPEEAEKFLRMRTHEGQQNVLVKRDFKKEAIDETVFLPPHFEDRRTVPSSEPALPSKLSISEIKRLYDITPDSSFRETPPPSFEPPAFIRAESGITPMRMGSALHKITEHIDYENPSIDELINNLTEKNILTSEEAAAIPREKIKTLTDSPLAERMKKAAAAGKLFREIPFVLALPAAQLYPVESDEKILVHGIIDCYFEENNKLILVDFKSDKITGPLDEWAETHRVQMEIYRQAIENATGMEVAETLLYSFSRGEAATTQAKSRRRVAEN
jgi:ATP-dependent helicase/nuclease subunit A